MISDELKQRAIDAFEELEKQLGETFQLKGWFALKKDVLVEAIQSEDPEKVETVIRWAKSNTADLRKVR